GRGSAGPEAQDKRLVAADEQHTRQGRLEKAMAAAARGPGHGTSGGVLFTGDLDNNFLVLDASNGNTLYKFNTGGSVGGGVVTYAVGGKAYVGAASGVASRVLAGNRNPAGIGVALP